MILLLLPLILGVVFLIFANVVGRWFVSTDPKRLARLLRSSGGAMLLILGVFLVARGQWVLGSALVATGFSRLSGHRAPSPFGGAGHANPSSGQASTVRTALLEATLDHDTGEIDALVLAGPFEGRTLNELTETECLSLWGSAARDEESRLLLEAYLDRRRPEWREDVEGHGDGGTAGAGSSGARGGPMTEHEAYEILGLSPGASEAEIRASHRRLMKQMHPDQGGSTFLAAKLNEAKDVLLRRR